MPFRLIHVSEEIDASVHSLLQCGRYAGANDVMSAALRLLAREERERDEDLALLRAQVEEGFASGEAEQGVFDRVYAYIDSLDGREGARNEQKEQNQEQIGAELQPD